MTAEQSRKRPRSGMDTFEPPLSKRPKHTHEERASSMAPQPSHAPAQASSNAMVLSAPLAMPPRVAPPPNPLAMSSHGMPTLTPMTALQPSAAPLKTLDMNDDKWSDFFRRSTTERRRDLAGVPAPVQRPSPALSNFHYDTGGVPLGHQVKYGPTAAIGSNDQQELTRHYGHETSTRLSQYKTDHGHYVRSAQTAGRGLTEQEFIVDRDGKVGNASINHVIASGTGQNLMNQMTLAFNDGITTFQKRRENVESSGNENHRKAEFGGIAKQAAAVARMTGIGRAMLTEEIPATPTDADLDVHVEKRNAMAKNVLTAFQGPSSGPRYQGFKDYLRDTFDSSGNLRVGHRTGNIRVSTGLDIPLTAGLTPTPRGERLYKANLNFGLPEMETPGERTSAAGTTFNAGIFTTTVSGQKLSSSKEQ